MMNSVSASELASIQAAAASVLDLPCIIQRKITTTFDGMGTSSDIYTTIAPLQGQTLFAGMAQPNGGQLANYAFIIGSLAAWQVKLPIGTDVQVLDQLIVAGQKMEVQVDLTPRSYPSLMTILASEVK
jgi:hypothetical protein